MSETDTTQKGVERALMAALDKAISINKPAVAAHVRRVRNRHRGAQPKDVIARLEKQYLATVIGIGVAAGGVAAAPVVGTATAVAINISEIASFLSASALFAL